MGQVKVCWVILPSCPSSGKPNTPFQLEWNWRFGFSGEKKKKSGKSDLVKHPLFFRKILLTENSHTATLVTSEITSHVHAGSQSIISPSFEKQQPLCCPWQPGLTWPNEKVSCKKVIMPKESLQLGCLFFLLLLQQQRESKGKTLLPQDMPVLRELMQLKNPLTGTG